MSVSNLLEIHENTYPTAAVQPGRVVPQFEKNLLHTERSGERLDENGCTDSVMGDADVRLRKQEDIVPEARFEIVLHLRQIEIGTGATGNEFLGIVIKV